MATIQEIRTQYPQYNDMSDQQLADSLYKAHYSDMPRDQFDSKIGLSQDTGFIGRVGGDLKNRFGKAVEAVGAGQEGKQSSFETGAQIAGNTMVGGMNDIIGEGVKSLTPDFVKNAAGSAVKSVFDTDIGKQALAAAQKGEQYYKDWAAKNPRAARNVEAGLNLSTVVPIGKVAGAAANAAPSVAKNIVRKFGEVADSRASSANAKELVGKVKNTPLESRAVKDVSQRKYDASEKMVTGEKKDPFLGTTQTEIPAARISPTYVQKMFDKVKLVPKSPYQEAAYADDAVNNILNKYQTASAHPMGVEDFEAIDKDFTQEIWDETDQNGILSARGQRLLDAQSKIREDVYKNITEKDIMGDKKAFQDYKDAVKTWHDAKLMENIELIGRKAGVANSNPGLVWRRGFERIYNNKAVFNSYPPEVQKMIQKALSPSVTEEYVRATGSRLLTWIAGENRGPIALAVAPAVSYVGRKMYGNWGESRGKEMLNALSDPYRSQVGEALSGENQIEGLSK